MNYDSFGQNIGIHYSAWLKVSFNYAHDGHVIAKIYWENTADELQV